MDNVPLATTSMGSSGGSSSAPPSPSLSPSPSSPRFGIQSFYPTPPPSPAFDRGKRGSYTTDDSDGRSEPEEEEGLTSTANSNDNSNMAAPFPAWGGFGDEGMGNVIYLG